MDNLLQVELRKMGYSGDFTLEALVEACGDEFVALTNGVRYGWKAGATVYISKGGHKKKEILGSGPTPTEAVARLYLRLQDNSLR